ncbi:hypothetical protein O9929_26280 [Vibrio lentus]|nr:hypothetical protein [Vibrio lentus]
MHQRSLRSLANLEEAQYSNITDAMNTVMQAYVARYEALCSQAAK